LPGPKCNIAQVNIDEYKESKFSSPGQVNLVPGKLGRLGDLSNQMTFDINFDIYELGPLILIADL